MKRITILFLAVLMALPAYPVETGPANTVLRVPSGGGRPKFGAVDLSQSVATANELLIARGGTQKSIELLQNVGLVEAQTSVAADSIKITSADHTAFSASNPGKAAIGGTTAGQTVVLSLTSDVTINLTGAHWGLGTNGDFSDVELRVYLINDGGSDKYGVGLKGGLRAITDTDTSTTPTNITSKGKILVNSALNAGTHPAREIGWFHGDFDDAGGSSEDLWEIQSGVGDLNVGIPVPDQSGPNSFPMVVTGASSNPTKSNSPTVDQAVWIRDGSLMHIFYSFIASTTTGAAAGSGSYIFNMPTGYLIDSSVLFPTAAGSKGICGDASGNDNTSNYSGYIKAATTTGLRMELSDHTTGVTQVASTFLPFTASSVGYFFHAVVPILQWSSNGN